MISGPKADRFLKTVSGPSRLLGSEINAATPKKTPLASIALLFPDVYDIGMCHLGYKIVYHSLNAAPDLSCERCFCPEPELERAMRDRGLGLTALESGRPLKEFDLIGFTLPHEMVGTNLLTMLDLAGLPLSADARTEADPIVIAGGPAAFNPEPMADFLDAVLLGDGETGALELARKVGELRRAKVVRSELLAELTKIDGVYVPGLYRPVYAQGRFNGFEITEPAPDRVTKRTEPDLDDMAAPVDQIVPFGSPIQDRLVVELARGCTRGCRFCQAGFLYRPVRERSPERLLQLARDSLAATGYDELSLLSLSAGDYSCFHPLLEALMNQCGPDRVAVSLPSMRADSYDRRTAEIIKRVRTTGLTLAPEAGSDRLRRVINKNLTEEQIVAAARAARQSGWKLLKLYFMIGLPSETEADLQALVDLVSKVVFAAPGLRVNVSVGLFAPKPITPFQWAEQLDSGQARSRMSFIREGLKRFRNVRFKWNSVETARLEGLISRGDRRLGPVIREAWERGARFEAWSEHFDWAPWQAAMDQAGLTDAEYLAARPTDQPLPWDHLSAVDKSYLLSEKAKAERAEQTADCRTGACQGCGLCDFSEIRPITVAWPDRPEAIGESAPEQADETTTQPESQIRRKIIVVYAKTGAAVWFGHLELAKLLYRAFRRAGITVGYSQGFHPQPRISFPEALPVGAASLAEWLQVEVIDDRPAEELGRLLAEQLPAGLEIREAFEPRGKVRTKASRYLVEIIDGPLLDQDRARARAAEFMAAKEAIYTRVRPKRTRQVDLRRAVSELTVTGPDRFELTVTPVLEAPTGRADETADHIFGLKPDQLAITKLETHWEGK